ncbi:MAG: PEGA domain-containing protein, partial [Methanomicrobiales archaeon]|nr:PEGA domain-containing protein [Methanomicrobiales archaeon]
KSDLISQYKTGQFLRPTIPIPTPTPTPIPTPDIPAKGSVPVSFTRLPGSIYVFSYPAGANIYLDGTLKGTTPITITGVSAGSHKLALTKSGYAGVRYTILGSTSKLDYTNLNDGFYSDGLSITVDAGKTVRILATLSLDIPSGG